MAGHNKWSQIKVKKGAEDAKKSKLFSLLVRGITMEAKRSAGNRESPGLKAAIQRARDANMPLDNIERAVQKGFGGGSENFEEVMYEAYGPAGVALIITGITDNKNRTTPEIKHLLSNHGGTLGNQGSSQWAFTRTIDGTFKPNALISLNQEDAQKLESLIEGLDEHADIKNVYHNGEL